MALSLQLVIRPRRRSPQLHIGVERDRPSGTFHTLGVLDCRSLAEACAIAAALRAGTFAAGGRCVIVDAPAPAAPRAASATAPYPPR